MWSGRVWQTNSTSSASSGEQSGDDQLQITAYGWFNDFGGTTGTQGGRLVHTGAEFQKMLALPNGQAWQAANGNYTTLGIDTAIQLAYSATQFPAVTDAYIIFDLLNRANIDVPTFITPGTIYGTPYQRNLTLQRFQVVGQEILQLVNVENGVDFYVDPLTRKMDLYGLGASPSYLIENGRGIDRGPETIFTYPGNCTSAQMSDDGTQVENRVEAIGQYGVGRAEDIGSQSTYEGLFEYEVSLSEVVDPNILVAYAQAEVAVKKDPWQIITFTPRGTTIADEEDIPGVPRPYEDFTIGDIVYVQINRGSFRVGVTTPQPVRMFGFTLTIDDDGIERLSSIQTTYQGTVSQ